MLDMMPQREGGRKTGFNITVKKLMAKIEILIQFNLKCHCDEKSLKEQQNISRQALMAYSDF